MDNSNLEVFHAPSRYPQLCSLKYTTQNGRVIRQTWDDNILDIIYDNHNALYAFCYSSDGGNTYTTYYYILNRQGDVVAIIDSEGTLMGSYAYDAWGKVEEENCLYNGNGVNIIEINPIRYRGYYYDEESGLYYLSMRYYDPSISRFLNEDEIKYLENDDYNSFLYCSNNPVDGYDLNGNINTSGVLVGLSILGTAFAVAAVGTGIGTLVVTGNGITFSVGMVNNLTRASDYCGPFVTCSAGYNLGFSYGRGKETSENGATSSVTLTLGTGRYYGIMVDDYHLYNCRNRNRLC